MRARPAVGESLGRSRSDFSETMKTSEVMKRHNAYDWSHRYGHIFTSSSCVSGRCSVPELYFHLCAINK